MRIVCLLDQRQNPKISSSIIDEVLVAAGVPNGEPSAPGDVSTVLSPVSNVTNIDYKDSKHRLWTHSRLLRALLVS